MKLTTLDEDLRIHQKLEDEPNDVGGLSAQALKEKFDQAGVTIQKYLNETHLPEEEMAVAGALAAAKAYTDAKAITLEQGNMKTAVYDAKKRRRDIFDYTDEKIAELQAKKSSGAWVFSGQCSVYSTTNFPTSLQTFTSSTDPDGLWSETEKAFVMPEGGTVALLIVHGRSCKNGQSKSLVKVLVNGTEQINYSMGYHSNSTWEFQTFMIPVLVNEGDRLSLKVHSVNGADNTFSQTMMLGVSMIVFA